MTEPDREHALEEYLSEFILRTNDGRVFAAECSVRNLISEETEERDEWAKTRFGLEDNYLASHVLSDLTVNDLVQLRVAPPLLVSNVSFSPPSMPPRLYPNAMYAWVDFENEVRSFMEPEVGNVRRVDNVLYHSLHAGMKLCDAVGERSYILYQVLEPLQKAGLLEHGTKGEAELLEHSRPLGDADHFLIAGVNKTVPIVFKTTHDLLIPEKAVDIIHRYKGVILAAKARDSFNIDWVRIGRPLGQLIKCMFDARSRYGVLSSGTRTYFFKVDFADDGPRVLITDAWFVGQEDLLRAWSYLFHLAKGNGDFKLRDCGEKVWPTWTTDGPHHRDPQVGRENHMHWIEPSVAPSIPRVDGKDIKLLKLLELGGNDSPDVYRASWKGNEVVLKMFCLYKHFEMFQHEICVYDHLKDSWGVLVPEPYFIAIHRGLMVFGMQLGRIPNHSGNAFNREQNTLFRRLRLEHGFRHRDLNNARVIYVPDKSRVGRELLVAIDLVPHWAPPDDE